MLTNRDGDNWGQLNRFAYPAHQMNDVVVGRIRLENGMQGLESALGEDSSTLLCNSPPLSLRQMSPLGAAR